MHTILMLTVKEIESHSFRFDCRRKEYKAEVKPAEVVAMTKVNLIEKWQSLKKSDVIRMHKVAVM